MQNNAALHKLAILANDSDKRISLAACRALLDASDKYGELLERFGLKDIMEDMKPQPQITINASDKELYEMLTPEQKKKLVRIAQK